jgi:sugar phosphate isomerase/epimerase
MRLGGPIFEKFAGPDEWVQRHRDLGYRAAAYAPVGPTAPQDEIRAYATAARKADLVIAEVGAWSNPIGPDEAARKAAVENCKKCLALAEALGARNCVNIAGSRSAKWAGPCREDLTDETFGMIVEVVRAIIDAVQPQRACYALETMPWMYPDSADAYLKLIRAIDRKAFAVHFDPVNLISSPQMYFRNGEMIRDFIARLGPWIRTCHAKDVILQDKMSVHLDVACPGKGALDFRAFLSGLATLDPDITVIMEHLKDAEEYDLGAAHIRQVAADSRISV